MQKPLDLALKDVYSFSKKSDTAGGKLVQLGYETLTENIKKLIRHSFSINVDSHEAGEPFDDGRPVLVGQKVKHLFITEGSSLAVLFPRWDNVLQSYLEFLSSSMYSSFILALFLFNTLYMHVANANLIHVEYFRCASIMFIGYSSLNRFIRIVVSYDKRIILFDKSNETYLIEDVSSSMSENFLSSAMKHQQQHHS